MSASQADVARIVASMSDIQANFAYAMTEVNRVTAAQATVAADSAPLAGWINDRLAAQQSVSDEAARNMLQFVNGAKLALDDLRQRVTETEKKPPSISRSGKCPGRRTWSPPRSEERMSSGRSSKRN